MPFLLHRLHHATKTLFSPHQRQTFHLIVPVMMWEVNKDELLAENDQLHHPF
jgi:hypothetical protein